MNGDLPAQPAKASPYDRGPDPASASIAGVPFIVNPARVDARNWLRKVASIFAPSGGRSGVITTDESLQDKRAPLRIPRALFTGRGLTGPNINIVQDTGSWAYIPGQDISTRNAGKAVPAMRTVDDSISIPAIYAGNPNGG